ncbi:RFC like checkpoint protein Rad17 [Schizosaccharomyces japonicus yFS275]|uniref:RFC like checkpoint protein Rad17 n=1 Tax=Schizosaccharomyces japonicus (strain yFS275 / FY16936) TaxID=402676 RepID=B6K0K7_SCHJY|nr:RFC like checkpoint protein Rad17 [Schizosaccharomyces japonicus yFS275]EEB07478.1 RFC like checkpoint protein Rad17 [Schizosaccharomyces japonicus yFS275]
MRQTSLTSIRRERKRKLHSVLSPLRKRNPKIKSHSIPLRAKGNSNDSFDGISDDDKKPSPNLIRTVHHESELWTDKFAPQLSVDLAVHKAKVTAVRNWMKEDHSSSRLLVLSGPSGCGKSTCVEVLARELNASLIEWSNPSLDAGAVDDVNGRNDKASVWKKFGQFMATCETYPELPLSAPIRGIASSRFHMSKKFVYLDELPMLSNRNGTIDTFRSLLLTALQSRGCNSIILNITETQYFMAEDADWQDQYTAYRLLGDDILKDPSVTHITFNPIASSFMRKALMRVMRLQTQVKQSAAQTSQVISQIIEGNEGDLRSAINNLQYVFTCRAAVSSKSSRDFGLGLFHAVGKVIWNKREGDDEATEIDNERWTPLTATEAVAKRPSMVDIADVVHTSGATGSIFRQAIFDNYASSCTNVNYVSEVCDCLSLADCLVPAYPVNFVAEELAAWYAVQATLIHLPTPVPRRWRQLQFRPQLPQEEKTRFRDYFSIYSNERRLEDADTVSMYEEPDDPIEDLEE